MLNAIYALKVLLRRRPPHHVASHRAKFFHAPALDAYFQSMLDASDAAASQ